MVNCSLTLRYFPVAWKAALVDPRLKKRCQSASLSNLRPVRNLSDQGFTYYAGIIFRIKRKAKESSILPE